MRPIWSGVLSFGLINIPVKLYSASSSEELSFNYLHKVDMSPIRYAKVCRADGKELTQADLVKGYEYQEGDYVVLTDADFKSANFDRTQSIEVVDFCKEAEIDTIYFEKPYFLEPDKGSAKAYAILRESLKKSKKVGIAKFVIHNREHLGIIKPHEHIIVLEQMRFEDELRTPSTLELPKHETIRAKELTMATSLIEHLTEHFDPSEYKDTYKLALHELIKAKIKGLKPKVRRTDVVIPSKSADLMILLKESLDRAKHEHHMLAS